MSSVVHVFLCTLKLFLKVTCCVGKCFGGHPKKFYDLYEDLKKHFIWATDPLLFVGWQRKKHSTFSYSAKAWPSEGTVSLQLQTLSFRCSPSAMWCVEDIGKITLKSNLFWNNATCLQMQEPAASYWNNGFKPVLFFTLLAFLCFIHTHTKSILKWIITHFR